MDLHLQMVIYFSLNEEKNKKSLTKPQAGEHKKQTLNYPTSYISCVFP